MGQGRRSIAQQCMLVLLCILLHAAWLGESAARGINGFNKGRSLQQVASPPAYQFQAWGDQDLLKQAYADGLDQENITGIQAIVAGLDHVSVIRSDGSAASYGFNESSQLAVPPEAQQPNSVTALAAGRYFTLALMSDGTVLGWGDNSTGQLAVPDDIQNFGLCTTIAAGWNHSLCLLKNQTVATWGLSEIPFKYQDDYFTKIVADVHHNVGILVDTNVQAWDEVNLDNGLIVQPPVDIFNITHVATGLDYTVTVQNGQNFTIYGDASSPMLVNLIPFFPHIGIKQTASGDMHVVVLLEDNTVWAWGYDYFQATDAVQGQVVAHAISAGSRTFFALFPKSDVTSLPPTTLATPPPLTVQPPPLLSSPPPLVVQTPPLLLSPPPLVLPPPPVLSSPPPIVQPPPPILSPPPLVVASPPLLSPPPPTLLPPPPQPPQVALPPPTMRPSPSPPVLPPTVISVPPPAVNGGVPPPPAGSGIIISQSPPPAPDSAVTASGTASSSHTTSAGAVAGGVIGGIVAAAALAVLAVWLIRRPGNNGAGVPGGTHMSPPPPAAGSAAYSFDGAAFVSVPMSTGIPPARLSTLAKSMSTPWYRSLLPSDRLSLALHAAKGMRFMHEQGLVHGGFSTASLLYEDDGTRVVIAAPPTGSQPYAAANKDASIASITPPEILTNPSLPPSEAADVYAFAIVLLEIMTGSQAYPGMRSADIKSTVLRGSRPDIPGGIDDMVAQAIISCWDQDPESRPPIYNVVALLEAVLGKAHRA